MRGNFVTAIKDTEFLQVEEIQAFFDKDSAYDDLVDFERDLAQICELVLLFSESPGSFAELGSFASYNEISEKMLVVIQSRYLAQSSFILKGPVARLRRDHPQSVFSFADATVGITNGQVSTTDSGKLISSLKAPIQLRLDEVKSRTTLDASKFNHLCKLYVGLLREAYALKDNELLELLAHFGFLVDVKVLRVRTH